MTQRCCSTGSPASTSDASRVESGVAAHLDHWFRWLACRTDELAHTEITLRGEPPIENYFALAGMLATFGGAEVEKVGNHRFLDLVRLIAEQDDHARVCLVHLGVEVPCHRRHAPHDRRSTIHHTRVLRPRHRDH